MVELKSSLDAAGFVLAMDAVIGDRTPIGTDKRSLKWLAFSFERLRVIVYNCLLTYKGPIFPPGNAFDGTGGRRSSFQLSDD